jgi:uncharacterized membrane protein YdjX (TVP38/TMEM64 family)
MSFNKIVTILAFVIIIGLVIYASTEAQGAIIKSVDLLAGYFLAHKIAGAIIFFAISAVAVLISPFSSVPLIPSAVLAWGKTPTLALLLCGWMAGGIVAYYLGSYSRERIMKNFVSLERVEYYKNRISGRTQFWLVVLFRLAIPSEVAGYTLGIVRYEFKKYLLATFVVELAVALASVYSSSILLSGRITLFLGILLVVVIVLYLSYFTFQKKIKKQPPF